MSTLSRITIEMETPRDDGIRTYVLPCQLFLFRSLLSSCHVVLMHSSAGEFWTSLWQWHME
jgi:hypothetical protein